MSYALEEHVNKLQQDRKLSRQGTRIAARYREEHGRIDRLVHETERRSPDGAQRRARIRAATRTGRTAVRARELAESRLVGALRRLLDEGLSIRAAADQVGVGYHQARQLIRAAEVGGQV